MIERYLDRTTSAAAFCAEHGLSMAQITYWRTKYLAQSDPAPDGFVRLEVPASGAPPTVEVAYPNGVVLRWYAPVGLASVHALVSA